MSWHFLHFFQLALKMITMKISMITMCMPKMIIGSVRVMLILTMTLSSNVNGDKLFKTFM